MREHTSLDVASTIREHIVDRKVNNSRSVDTLASAAGRLTDPCVVGWCRSVQISPVLDMLPTPPSVL